MTKVLREYSLSRDDNPDNIPIEQLERHLPIDEHALEQACVTQPDTFYKIARKEAYVISRRDKLTQHIKELEATADAQIRHEAEVAGDRITETDVKNQVRLDKNVLKANDELLALNLELGKVSALKEAFKQRGYVLRYLVELFIAGYYGEITSRSDAETAKNANARAGREGMQRMRRRAYDRE